MTDHEKHILSLEKYTQDLEKQNEDLRKYIESLLIINEETQEQIKELKIHLDLLRE